MVSERCYCFVNVFSVIDVGSEWRTFSNEKSATDRSRVGAAEVSTLAIILRNAYRTFQ